MFSRVWPHATAIVTNAIVTAFTLYFWSFRMAKVDFYNIAGLITFAVLLYIPWGLVLDTWNEGDSTYTTLYNRITILAAVLAFLGSGAMLGKHPLATHLPLLAKIVIGQHVALLGLSVLQVVLLTVRKLRERAESRRRIKGFYEGGDSFEDELPGEDGQRSQTPKKRGGTGTVLDMVGRDED